ncbi:hypothetical protein OIU74_024254 [Salix koriyanagi]|uniref:Uncharacterized protein n=1 Tax=Salix koriyanagi TaxID=2511006 RepID=A0A9Q1A8B5_9ROSI|nr:hypothetical protein OIU74_024254 [Salix koriyanagi]
MGPASVYSIHSPLWTDTFAECMDLLWTTLIPADTVPHHCQIPHGVGLLCNCHNPFNSDSSSSQMESEGAFLKAKCFGIRPRGRDDEEAKGS